MWRSVSKTVIRSEIGNLSKYLRGEMITDHAGELGAVHIYIGATHALAWRRHLINNPRVDINQLSEFIDHHLESEKVHLSFFEEMMPSELQTNLTTLWRISGCVVFPK